MYDDKKSPPLRDESESFTDCRSLHPRSDPRNQRGCQRDPDGISPARPRRAAARWTRCAPPAPRCRSTQLRILKARRAAAHTHKVRRQARGGPPDDANRSAQIIAKVLSRHAQCPKSRGGTYAHLVRYRMWRPESELKGGETSPTFVPIAASSCDSRDASRGLFTK